MSIPFSFFLSSPLSHFSQGAGSSSSEAGQEGALLPQSIHGWASFTLDLCVLRCLSQKGLALWLKPLHYPSAIIAKYEKYEERKHAYFAPVMCQALC